jgi:NAD(P)-dependent dehydrogenase (short-subunit alcohol dehydrogenase family)
LDYLVNCAAVDRVNNVLGATDEQFDWIIGVNVKGTFLCCRGAIPMMRDSGGGAIVNMGSTQGFKGAPRAALYCASKGAVHQLTKCMAIDHAVDRVRVNCVAPGAIDTPMLARELAEHPCHEEALKQAMNVPLARLGKPEEIASVVYFLLSEHASYMTGAIVTVDGGEAA